MENLKIPSSLLLVLDVQQAIERNKSVVTGVSEFINRSIKDSFTKKFLIFWKEIEVEPKKLPSVQNFLPLQRPILILLYRAMSGFAIYDRLIEVRQEMLDHCSHEIESHVQKLPIKLQLPMLLLIFPSILILILIPALKLLQTP